LISHVVGLATSQEAWQALACMFLSQSRARILQVHFQLATIKKGGSSITEYFQKFKNLVDTITVADQSLIDFVILSFLLAGLGSEFDPFVTSVTTWADPMFLEELYAHLITHEMQLEHNLQSTEAVFPSANTVAHFTNPKHKGQSHGPHGSTNSNYSSSQSANHYHDNHQGRGCGRSSFSHSLSGSNSRLLCLLC
jgi:hypothetical protein